MTYHDTGYKELFSYPEFVQQLIEGFTPQEMAQMMDFSTLELHSGNYITPLFEEKREDVVWSVNIDWQGNQQQIYLYLLLEFQSSIDSTMPIRLMHYVACFYDHLLKNKTTTPSQGLPPVFPIVLYNGIQRWSAKQDIYQLVTPEPPAIFQPYQPHLRYYLIDEGAYTDDELEQKQTPLSGVFSIEKASNSRENLQQAVNRIVRIIQNDPHKQRLDRVITRWLKRHLQRLEAEVNLKPINSLIEDNAMLAENLQHWAEKERQLGREEGLEEGREEGRVETALELIKMSILTDQQIASASRLSLQEVAKLKNQEKH